MFLPVGTSSSSGSNSGTISSLSPPIKVLQIISHWVFTFPDLLSPKPLLDKDIFQLPIIHSQASDFHSGFGTGQPDPNPSAAKTLLPGIIQWCVLAPLSPPTAVSASNGILKNPGALKEGLFKHSENREDTLRAIQGLSLTGTDEKAGRGTSKSKIDADSETRPRDGKEDVHTILASLHADILSNILSLPKPLTCQLSGDDIAVVVAALLSYYSQRTQEKEASAKQRGGEGCSLSGKMDDCVERLAQILQICLSSGLVDLRPGE